MFAALQKASWNWVPISVSGGPAESDVKSQVNDFQSERNKMIQKSQNEFLVKATGEWVEIPLSSDDEDRISPRGILQFRKFSEGELSERSRDGDDLNSLTSNTETTVQTVSLLQAETETEDILKSGSAPACCHATETMLGEVEVGKDCGDANARASLQRPNSIVDCRRDEVSIQKLKIFEDWNMDLATQQSKSSQSPIEASIEKVALVEQRNSSNAGTQTPSPRDDFASTKMALQRQLADALSALDLTRNQANALRDRLRTYTSSMKQQATDLRASSKSLSHALDKAKEYRTNWKREEKLKDAANKRADELDVKTKSLEKTIAQHSADIKSFNREVDILNRLLGVESAPESVEDKLAIASNEVKVLLNLVEKVQAEAALASAVNTVELKESLRRFEEEKASWIAFTAKNEEVFTGKIKFLEMKNDGLKNQIDSLQESSREIRELWQQDRIENGRKEQALKMNDVTIRDLETALSQTREELKASASSLQSEAKQREQLREAFHVENTKLAEEKRQIAATLVELKRDLEEKRLNRRDQSVHCDLHVEIEISRSNSDSSLSDGLRSSTYTSESQLRRSVSERKALHKQVDELKRIMADMKTEIFEKEREYFRLRGDFRHLNWTSHHQQVTIQRVRAENRSLRTSLSKLRRGRESQEGYIQVDNHVDLENQPSDFLDDVDRPQRQRRRSSGDSTSDSERKHLQTIPESSDEEPMSSRGVSPVNTKAPTPQPGSGSEHDFSTKTDSVSPDKLHMKVNSPEGNSSNVASLHAQSMTSWKSSDRSGTSSRNRDPRSTRKKRSRKTKRAEKSWLPIWRQENPDNKYSSTPIGREARSVTNSSSESEDVFASSSVSQNETKSPTSDQSLAELPIVADQPSRLVGIPMDEREFERLIGSLDCNNLTPIARPRVAGRPIPAAIADTSLNDDGYSSSAAGAGEANDSPENGELLHFTRLFSNSSNGSSGQAAESCSEEPRHCFLTYGDVTFDAMTFDLTQMRNIAWEAGFTESDNDMNNFIDFLAAKAEELEEDPQWQGRHCLGKSSEWLSLKGLLS